MALPPETIEETRDGSGVLAEFGGFALEAVYFFKDLDGNKDGVFFEVEE
jgi:hypothetical protein